MSQTANRKKMRQELFEKNKKFYKKQLDLGRYSQKHIAEFQFRSNLFILSTVTRFSTNIQQLKYTYMLEKTNMICTAVKLSRNETTSIIGYLYGDKTDYMYLCIGGAFRSQDGEYRRSFIAMERIGIIQEKYPLQWKIVEEYCIQKLQSGATLLADIFYTNNVTESEQRKYEEKLNTDRMVIKVYMLAIISDYYKIHNKIIENHIHPSYQYVIYDSDDDIYDSILESFQNDINHYSFFVAQLDSMSSLDPYNIPTDVPLLYTVRTGQKLFPLTVKETVDLFDIESSIWKEYYIGTKCNDIVANLVSPSFPIQNDWFLVQNIHPGAFDNPTQLTKFQMSDISDKVVDGLHKADQLTYQQNNELSVKRPLSKKFSILSEHIKSGISYAENNISVTNAALAVHSEYVGRTLRDIPAIVSGGLEQKLYNNIKMYTDPDIFAGYLFELTYGLYALNTIVGSLHGDMHINNATIYKYTHYNNFIDDTSKVYIIDDKESKNPNIFMFKHYGAFAAIIDFSRSIIGNRTMIENDFGNDYAETFFRNQNNTVKNMIAYHFEDFFEKNKDDIEIAIKKKFSLVFKILTLVDMYTVTRGLLMMFKVEKEFDVHEKTLGLVKLLNDTCKTMFLNNFTDLISGKLKTLNWPNYSLMTECFIPYKLTDMTRLKTEVVVDIFTYRKVLRYSLQDYEKFPDILKIEPILESYKKYELNSDDYQTVLEFFKDGNENELEEISDRYKRRESQPDLSWMWE